MIHKNFKNIDKVIYGRGSFSQLAETIAPNRIENNNYFVYVIDNYFKVYCYAPILNWKKFRKNTERKPLKTMKDATRRFS